MRNARRWTGAFVAVLAWWALPAPVGADVTFDRSIPIGSGAAFTVDDTGDILVARAGAIDRYSSTGTPETGFTTGAGFASPADLDFAGGRIWASAQDPDRVWTWLPNGTDEAATSADTAYQLNLNVASGLAVAGGSAHLTTSASNRLTSISTSPLGQTVAVSGVGVATGSGTSFETCQPSKLQPLCSDGFAGDEVQYLNNPQDVVIGPVSGKLYVVEAGYDFETPSRVKVVGPGPFPELAFGAPGTAAGQFTQPTGIAVDATEGAVYVADLNNHRIMQFTAIGAFVQGFGYGVDTGAAQFETCTTQSGCQAGIAGAGPGQLSYPSRLEIDSGDLYVRNTTAFTTNSRVDIFSLGGEGPAEKSVTLKAKPKRVKKGGKTTLTATLTPCPATAGEPVQFERFKGADFQPIGSEATADGDCSATRKKKVKKATTFRATSSTTAGFTQAISNEVQVRIK